ncbi:MAG: Holliday junction branch migration protein RuvA [Peptoniphilaceae bacterium]|uniref:Holliday junction branch migration protein RuvA n=1 Tax=Parvimonas sp. TaxID=1944660 RepID=UPI0025FE8674|nr:Holliday junction branch migration protein RuvA [Parvimonas sp.]MCI5996666.1 Holliday junction branch migration protein RuvA [Parvimonas sp.]MDD7764951.1 Holliday junction branch migration protein RuvA [Peptoniphilaceae bacterium]MDY3050365.1 Holliday junction branch migration protein RuvA [Parvimonas sp.]
MYEYISGELKFIYNDYIVIDNNGIGYKIFTSNNTIFNVTVGEFYTIYTDYIVKEDYVALFGFKTTDELSMFKLLISVNSIGPKVACGILSSMSIDSLKLTIINADAVSLATAKGVGKKTAQKIIIELKDKISIDSISGENLNSSEISLVKSSQDISKKNLVLEALVNLGFMKTDIEKFLSTIDIETMEIEEIIKLSMKKL